MADDREGQERPKSAGDVRADLIVRNAKVATMRRGVPDAEALAVQGETLLAVGTESEVMRLAGRETRVIDADGRRVIPGLNDSHIHAIRGGLRYNLELRWDGVRTLRRALEMVREQALRTPPGQWVQVMGGWSPYQFVERRMPSPAELTRAAPTVPVLVLFGYSRVLLNVAGVNSLSLSTETAQTAGSTLQFVDGGAVVEGNTAVYATIARLPSLSEEMDRISSTEQFLRELNRFGLTSVVDAGESATVYPDDYVALATLAKEPTFPVRVSNFLFAQKPGTEIEFWQDVLGHAERALNQAGFRQGGYVLHGAGEVLAWSAHDYENFLAPRPDITPEAITDTEAVARLVAKHQWPIRIHATYDETISQILDVFEQVFDEVRYDARWAFDHAESIGPRNIDRVKALGGGIAVQNRLSFSGEFFLDRYGEGAAVAVQPLRQILDAGIPVGAGTDATRPASYNPWVSLHWMITGRTVGGTQITTTNSRLSRLEALQLYTTGSAWFSGEETVKGTIAAGQYADFAVLSDDYLSVPEDHIPRIESVLTVTGGDVVYSAPPFTNFPPPALRPLSPEWAPVGGYQQEES